MFDIQLKDDSYISLIGRFSAANSQQAEAVLEKINRDCIIDFKNLEYISSSGIGSIVRIYSKLLKSGHSLRLINMNNHIREVFSYAGLDKILTLD
jgi:anti-anti-sigma factor